MVNLPLQTAGYASMTFAIPSEESSIQIALCMVQVGSPTAPVAVNLYDGSGTLRASGNILPSQVPTGSASWTQFVPLTPLQPLMPGYYTIVVNSLLSNVGHYYLIYINFYGSFNDANATALYIPPSGSNGNKGSPVVWVKDAGGNDLTIFPLGLTGGISSVGNGTFVAASNYQINCLVLWLSDMEYILPPYSAEFILTDTTSGSIVGTAPASQYYNSHGLQGLLPLQFPSPVQIIQGHSYSVSISESGNAGATSAYSILVRGVKVNPAKAGPSGSASYWLGELALSDFSQYRILDYATTTSTVQNGHGGIGGVDEVAVRIVPNFNETITQIRLKMSNAQGAPITPGSYPSGTPITISLYASNESAPSPVYANPSGSPLASATVDSGTIPSVGFFNATVNFPVNANTPYWIVWSSPSAANSTYNCQRCVSPFRNLALASQNKGSSWSFFGQGPTDLAFAAIASQETLGSPV